MNNKFFVFIAIFILYLYIFIQPDNYNLNDLKFIVDKHINNSKKINELEQKLLNYKFTSSNEFFNIINRKNIEKNIQKRNQIIKEINNLTTENEKYYNDLIKFYNLLYADIKDNYNNQIFMFIINYIDNLKLDFFKKLISLSPDEIKRLNNEKKNDILKSKYQYQEYIVKDLTIFIKNLKIKQDLYKINHNIEIYRELTNNIKLLDNILDIFNTSQNIIKNYIK
jgi:hypothetical protein